MFEREKPQAPQTESEQLYSELHEKFDPALKVLAELAGDLHYPDYDPSTPKAAALRVLFSGSLGSGLEDFKKFVATLD